MLTTNSSNSFMPSLVPTQTILGLLGLGKTPTPERLIEKGTNSKSQSSLEIFSTI